ncbi:hypothetical protein Z517_07086 [Fonsecaea pedrosoi CBS 271.37]|uniref:Zn(2)-C6 fungal-type domain-containing protein n=1 Tax=Fonsecaea pedrosoi CBS 271.37 TaxID=1442368 RepID=A0A0D2GPM7_9EURO|nr:uncharacterized protein Z517_07086 [Fonsecaea pedrosoi CBS 271.37]KIW80470.1 hypothetical protein Z517_07086 [Fonsecaea pedrosoi CBS 271.37]
MGRYRRQTGHLQGTFEPPRIQPSQRPGQSGLYSTQPQYNQLSQPPFSTPALQPHWHSGQPRPYSFVVAESHNTPSTTDALSPASTRSTHSRGSVATPTSTSYTAALGYVPTIPQDADGTCSPSASLPTSHPAEYAGNQPMNPAALAVDHRWEAARAMTDAAVVGVDPRASVDELSHYPDPAGQQRFPGQNQPWSTQLLRQENLYFNTGPRSPVIPVLHYRHSLTIRERGRGGRTRPLNPVQRQETRDVRKRGACLRCVIMKEKCDCKSPCNNCFTKDRRKCPKYCIPSRCDWDVCKVSLFPHELTSRLRKEYLVPYLANTTICVSHRPFWLQLELHIGIPLDVLVMEFSPPEPDWETRYAFETSYDCNGEKTLARDQNWNPPIVMFICNGGFEKTVAQVRSKLVGIFDQVLNDPQRYVTWTEQYFEDEDEAFQCNILRLIGRYYRDDIAEHSILKDSLQLLWFEYLLLNRFVVPAEAVSALQDNLSSKGRYGAGQYAHVIPETINRFLKATLLPGAERAAERLLKSLHDMMFKMAVSQKSSQSSRDLVLCMLFILVIYVGRAQLGIFMIPQMPGMKEETGCSQEQAEAKIEEMEQRVCDFLLSFHKYALSRTSSRSLAASGEPDSPSERHARAFGLENKLRHEIEEHVSEKPERLEPGEFDMNTIRYLNVRRLCWKVIENMK